MSSVEDVEHYISLTTQVNGIRISDRFIDFDKLRSGFVTVGQFYRILRGLINLTQPQVDLLSAKYGNADQTLISYSHFCRTIAQTVPNKKYLATDRTENTLNEESEVALTDLITSLAEFYNKTGVNVYRTFKDFDCHNLGRITESQFFRAFQRPEGFKERDLALIVSKYRNRVDHNLVNYLNFCHDVTTVGGEGERKEEDEEKGIEKVRETRGETVGEILERFGRKVVTNGIRAGEFFGDHDKLRKGVVGKEQFKSVVYRMWGKELGLGEEELERVALHFGVGENGVEYKEFCKEVEGGGADLERCPTGELRKKEGKEKRMLEKEGDVGKVIGRIAKKVRERRLGLGEWFKDFDMGVLKSGLITRERFWRCLGAVRIELTEEEGDLLFRKYGDEGSGWIHYRKFLEDVEEWDKWEECKRKVGRAVGERKSDRGSDLESLMGRIGEVVLRRRIRIKEFFSEFDELRHGVVTKEQFRRLLSQMGLSRLGCLDLADDEFEYLARVYSSENPLFVRWREFAADVNRVFESDHHTPIHSSLPLDTRTHHLVGEYLEKIKTDCSKRGLSFRPTFRDFDGLKSGFVTRSQFGQCLSLLQLNISTSQRESLEIVFCESKGFNYERFLEEVEPVSPPEYMYPGLVAATKQANDRKALEDHLGTDLRETMAFVRESVSKRDVRLQEFMAKFDRLNHGVITKSEFHRSLDSLNIKLSPNQLGALLKHYQTSTDEINYREFCQTAQYGLETDFLEKFPTAVPPDFSVVSSSVREGEDLSAVCDWVRQRRVDMFPLFRDFDPGNKGVVSRSQFLRCLGSVGAMSLLRDQSRVCQMFTKSVGGLQGVDYVDFCRRVGVN